MSEFLQFLEEVVPLVEKELYRLLPPADRKPRRLHEAMRYSLFAGGKRVRPALVLLAGDALGAPRSSCLAGAAAMELVHTFSLVHDDLPALDDDDLRRGRPTVHRQFDEATAILVGDALLNLGIEILLTEPESVVAQYRAQAAEVVTRAVGTGGMIGGQMADLDAERSWPRDASRALEWIHRRKTGALIAASVRLGGLYAGASENEDRNLEQLGQRLGLMFQIADDILDVEGTSDRLGKSVNKDMHAKKLTFPALYGLETSKRRLAKTRDEALAVVDFLPSRQTLFRSLVEYLSKRDR